MRKKKWKIITAGALSICMMATCAPYLAEAGGLLQSPVTVHAETNDVIFTGNFEYSPNITWNYNRTTKVLTIAGSGTSTDYGDAINRYKSEIKKLVFSEGITEIGSQEFKNFPALEEIEFGGVKKIGDCAFSGCTSLKNLNLDGNLEEICEGAFNNCKNLTTITVGPKLKTVYYDVFDGCDNVTSIDINKDNTYLYTNGKKLFASKFSGTCGKNVKYSYNAQTKTLTLSGSGAMDAGKYVYVDSGEYEYINSIPPLYSNVLRHEMQTLIVGDKITSIGAYAFPQCKALKTVKLGKKISTIDDYAFIECTALETIQSGNNVKSIGKRAFSECSNLNKIGVLTNLTKVGSYSFYGCNKLKTFSIGKSLKSIGKGAFSQCTGLRKFSVHKSNKYFSKRDNMLLNKSQSKIVSACFGSNKTCHIYGSVKDIDKNILNDSSIKSFSLNKKNSKYSVKGGLLYSKDGKTLLKCPSAMSGVVNIGDSVTKIASDAFLICNNITQINIGKNVKTFCLEPECISAKKLNKIKISNKNKYYYETNGSVISKTNDELIYCYKTGEDAYIIPDTVKKIGEWAFFSQRNLKKITLSNPVKIEYSSFRTLDDPDALERCLDIESIYLEKSYNDPTNKFEGFSEFGYLKEITVSNENPNYTSINGVLYDKEAKELLFLPNCLATYTIPESITSIDWNAIRFYNLKNLTISDTMTDTTEWLTDNSVVSYLESLHIGKNVSTLINNDYRNIYEATYKKPGALILPSLKNISVDEENSTFKTVNNMLYSKDGSTFILCPAQTKGKVVLEKGVTTISGSAFVYCEEITDIVIPDTVSKIDANAFYTLDNIVIWVPKGKKDYYKSLFTETTGFKSNMVIMELEN